MKHFTDKMEMNISQKRFRDTFIISLLNKPANTHLFWCCFPSSIALYFLLLIRNDCLCLSVSTLLLKDFKITANSSRPVLISCATLWIVLLPKHTSLHPPQSPSSLAHSVPFPLPSPSPWVSVSLSLNN